MKKFLKALLIVLLCIVLIAAAAAAYLFLTMKNLKVDGVDLDALAAMEPMDPSDRFEVDAATGVISIKADLSDAAYLLKSAGMDNDDINNEIKKIAREAGMQNETVGLSLSGEGLRIDAAMLYGNLRLAGSVYCDAEGGTDGTVKLIPRKAGIGFIRIPLSFIEKHFGVQIPSVEFSIPELKTTLIRSIESISVEEGCVKVSGTFNSDLLEILSTKRNTDPIYRWYSDGYRYVIDAGELHENGETEKAVGMFLGPVQDGTLSMGQAISDLLTVCNRSNIASVTNSGGKLWSERLFPGLTAASTADAHKALQDMCEERAESMKTFAAYLNSREKDGDFSVKGGQLLYNGGAPDIETLLKNADASAAFPTAEDISLCVVEFSLADRRNKKPLNKVADSADSFSARVYMDLVYPVGAVFKAKNGSHVLVYSTYEFSQLYRWHSDTRQYQIPEHLWQDMDTEDKVAVMEEKKV